MRRAFLVGHGRAVVATPVNGVADLVRDGENGLLVPGGDARTLRDSLARLTHEQGLAARLGAAARRTAEEFAWDRVPSRLEAMSGWSRAPKPAGPRRGRR